MSEHDNNHPALGWLLLRDGHAIPITGLEPEALKKARMRAVLYPEEPLKHTTGLNAIVGALGFKGDFGDYKRTHWPRLHQFLREHGCEQQMNAFALPWDATVLSFGPSSRPTRQCLSDRYFLGPAPAPRRVFLGVGVDWDAWQSRAQRMWPTVHWYQYHDLVVKNREDAIKWLLKGRNGLFGQWGFLDDKLVDGPLEKIVDKTYFTADSSPETRRESMLTLRGLVQVFRAVFDGADVGWVDILPYNDRLAFLRASNGGYDILWKDLRDAPPPQVENTGSHGLHTMDLPANLRQETDLERLLYFRCNVWREQEAHAAEQHFYDRGGSPQERRNTPSGTVVELFLRAQGTPMLPEHSTWDDDPPAGFREVEISGQRLLISNLVSVSEFRRMLEEMDYLARREGDAWERANLGEPADVPVGASWRDAQAFCAWKERLLGVPLRLLSCKEHRAIRPFLSKHYEHLSYQDFPWESWPPRPIGGIVPPSAVRWSEPRFEEPSQEIPEFPDDGGASNGGRKRWIKDFPPSARWSSEIPWATHQGLGFIDAWDAYEWCQEQGWISGRYWEGPIADHCWGAYKNVKLGFRVVMTAG